MTFRDMQSLIDWFLSAALNVWLVIKSASPVLFAIMVGLCLYPIFRRFLRAIRGDK